MDLGLTGSAVMMAMVDIVFAGKPIVIVANSHDITWVFQHFSKKCEDGTVGQTKILVDLAMTCQYLILILSDRLSTMGHPLTLLLIVNIVMSAFGQSF